MNLFDICNWFYSKTMTRKIITITEIENIAKQLHSQRKKIVLAGGCFDILHQGHINFLAAAKTQGDILVVLLESDASVHKRKGDKRPIHSQEDRAKILASLAAVDYIVLLPTLKTDQKYDTVVLQLKPAIIATTRGDPGKSHKERQAERIKATVIDVIDRLPAYASSSLAKNI